MNASLNPTNGHLIAGSLLDNSRFVGRMRAAQLFQIAPDPRDAENTKKRDTNKELQDIQHIRDEVQRQFEGAKRSNVRPYAEYIVALGKGLDGITPPITLYCEHPLEFFENSDGTGLLQVPWEIRLVAIDGETQLAARHEAQSIDPETRNEFVPVYICFGRSQGWARQSFHDLNTLAVRPNTALSMGMDARDPITKVASAVEERVTFFRGRVNKNRRQLRDRDSEVTTITGLRGAIATLAKGIGGVKYGSRPVPIEPDKLPMIEDAAVDWFSAVAEAIGPAIENRANTVAGSNPVMAAIGAMGHSLTQFGDPTQRQAEAFRLASNLQRIHWARDDTWNGIAGKSGKNGLTIAGTKEAAYHVYAALTDGTTEAYRRVHVAPDRRQRP